QPGSAIKPFIYTAALQQHFTPADVIVDEPVSYPTGDGSVWKPQNYTGTFAGPVTLRDALEESINVVAVKLLAKVGVNNVINLAKQMGITTFVSPNDNNLALALGGLTRGVSLLQLTEAYGVFANQGIRVEPYAIEKVVDANGNVIYQAKPQRTLVLDEQIAYLITDMMRGVVERGTGIRANIGRPVAGKTGTADDYKNAWFVGFTPDVVTGIWMGDDENKPMTYPNYGNVGSSLPAQIWGDYMGQALASTPVDNFVRPPGLVDGIRIDVKTGLLAPEGCRIPANEVRQEIFIDGTQPTKTSDRCSSSPFGGFSLFGFSF
ncbi:MAG TPA: penicillin-binding transpeptidase domain-containing protein, partial [Limnochordia bacterium]|nr:penicillin-binding transpeptidase domain-containing protein [Limnochordia bacterium]